MSAAFTPGPWDWWDMDNHVRVTEAAEQRLICEVTLPSDARLIAAAPELYEALDRMIHKFGGSQNPPLSPGQNAALQSARDALAKARDQ